ncbi:MAG: hypothetical protein ACKVS8_10465 [Phycisphaerales bacterium]
MHRAQVKVITRRAQIAGGVLLVACVGVALMPGSWAVGRSALEPVPAPTLPPPAPVPVAVDLPDAALLASALNSATPDMPRDPAPPEAGTPEGEDAPPPPPPPPPTPAWKYVGAIIGPGVRKAIVSVDEKQHFADVGEKVQGDEIVDVQADRLVVRAGGVEREVMQAAKTDRPVSASFGGPGPTAGGAPQNGAAGVAPGVTPGVTGPPQPTAINPRGINPLTGRPNVAPGPAQPAGSNPKPGRITPPNRLGRPASGAAAPATPPRVTGGASAPHTMTKAEVEEARKKSLQDRQAPPSEEDKR